MTDRKNAATNRPQEHPASLTASDLKDDDDVIDLSAWAARAWRQRKVMVAAMVIAALALGGVFALLRIALPGTETWRSAVQFTFPGASRKQYPNGQDFSIQDVVAPAVLEKVYKDNHLEDYQITRKDFFAAIGVQPYSPVLESVLERYRQRLKDRKLTFETKKKIERELLQEVRRLTASNALVTFSLGGRLGLPQDLGRKIVESIPATWASLAIEKQGVLDLPEALDRKPLVDRGLIAQVDYPLAAVLLENAAGKLGQKISRLEKLNIAATVSDPETGETIASLRRDLDTFSRFVLPAVSGKIYSAGLVKNARLTKEALERQITELELQRRTTERLIRSDENMLRYLQGGQSNATTSAGREALRDTRAENGMPGNANGMMLTLGDKFFDRLVAFVEQGIDKEGRVERRKRIDALLNRLDILQRRKARLEGDISRVKAILASFNGQGDVRSPEETARLHKEVEQGLDQASRMLNRKWEVLRRLYAAVSPRNLSYQGKLYAPLALKGAERHATWHPLMNLKALLLLLAAVLGVGMLTLVLALAADSMRRRREEDG